VFNLKDKGSALFIKGILDFTYVTNDGAAFGMLSNARWIFLLGTGLITLFGLYYIAAQRLYHWTGRLCAVLIVAGGIGNMIDRFSIKYVIDFIDFNPLLSKLGLSFAIFNLADSFVCIGAVFFAVYALFVHDKHEPKSDSEFINPFKKSKKNEEA
jgi:signal peptidase II